MGVRSAQRGFFYDTNNVWFLDQSGELHKGVHFVNAIYLMTIFPYVHHTTFSKYTLKKEVTSLKTPPVGGFTSEF